jgi:hypothetical protein
MEFAQPLPPRGCIEALPCNRITANSCHGALFRGVAFQEELLKQGAQVQFRSHFPVRQNGEGAISFALKVPANDF